MPKIRIKPEDTVTNKRVCRIDIVNWNDSVILNVEIGSRNFRDNSNTYSGNYLKQYYDLLTNLEFGPGRMLNPEDKFFHDWGETCHIDFRVYYYNECEMWIDYVKLENLPAHELLTVHDATRENWILQETENALSHGGNSSWRFYAEEFEFNTVPCVGYLNNVIDSIARLQGKDLSLMVNLNYDLFQAHIPFYYDWTDPMTAQDIDHYLIKKGKLKEVFIGSYPLQGYGDDNIHPVNLYYHNNQLPPPTYHPSTLTNSEYNYQEGRLSYLSTPTFYDNWLQTYLDNSVSPDKLLPELKLANEISKISNVPFINLIQAHLWWVRDLNGHRLKEPTNQEMDLMVNLGVSYGAKGIIYFAFTGENCIPPSTTSTLYFRGLTNPVDCNSPIGGQSTFTPRTLTSYGQNKWNGIKDINSRLKKWGPYIMSFDTNRQSYIYRLENERNALISNTYFSDIVSYKPGNGAPPCEYDDPGDNPPSNLIYECNSERYLQAATFKNTEPNSQYFMIINRRCSPFISDSTEDKRGGKRFIRVRLDANHSAFSGFNNWKISDIENSSTVVAFDKRSGALLDLGWLLPAQGKLYKIAPVMQEGGTLVADEECGGVFDCKGEVNNNGKNIFLKPGTNISFADHTARIKMTVIENI